MSRLLVVLIIAAGACLISPARAQPAQATLKAALLYRFVQYSEWSDNPPAQQHYCIAQDTGVFNSLTEILAKQAQVSLLTAADQATECTVLYLTAELASKPEWSQLLQASDRLTVVEGAELFRQGAMFGLIAEPHRISFRVNLTLAREKGFHLSAQMLKLAKEIH
ncbi:YfiR family protein [Arsukibacterium sp.]|uniref:YfiR family protein n=1 Tax=Arsukibacterium sp. TaxID=1977258 RepID=UPI00299E58E1|nr:YfiR family protein [Arsukibacterium sp.]MDX1536871.1 YfiR family protein [Arsukibacterium sp.]